MGTRRKNQMHTDHGSGIRTAASLAGAFLAGVGMALAWGAVSALLHPERWFPDTVLAGLFSQPLQIQIALYGIVSPVLEEFLFRLLLFDLVKRFAGEKAGTWIVSALFALWHGNVLQMLYAFPAGLILQKLRSRSGRMEVPILCHIGANLTAILISSFMRQAFPA